ncbi:MAG: AraC family transcriptional regulator [Planctomycetota bacterium]|nr:MAG: AraC family transcriptional regulator [Planctomycetota bacterium]
MKTQEIPAAVAIALDHFEHHLADPITPTSLAKSAGISPLRFARLMKRFFGLTPSQYIAKNRIAAASVLLRETDQPVTDIAMSCGYYDHSAFTRAFRKIAGVSPTQFRERQGASRR